MSIPIVIHIPHAKTVIPEDISRAFCLDDTLLENEVLKMTDWHTDRLFSMPDEVVQSIVYPVSRLVCDPERFENDAVESMSKMGMGVIYTKTHDFGILRKEPTIEERESILDRFYRPHHLKLENEVSSALNSYGSCLVVDAHSFPSSPLPYEQNPARPDICIGTDSFHTPTVLRDNAINLVENCGWTVNVNEPFAGALVPTSRYHKDSRVFAIMIEVNRRLYLDEATGKPIPEFSYVATKIQKVVLGLAAKFSNL